MAQTDASYSDSLVNHDSNSDQIRVFVIGEIGVGKSSLIKGHGAVNNNKEKPTVGHRSESETQKCGLFETKDYIFADTPGLGEVRTGKMPTEKVLASLVEFFLINQDGFHVAMFAIENIRSKAHTTLTFDVYRTILENKKIPCILICTKAGHKAGKEIEETEVKRWSEIYPFVGGLYVDYDDVEEIEDLHDRECAVQRTKRSNAGIKKLLDRFRGKSVALYRENNFVSDFYVWWNRICLKLGLHFLACTKDSIVKICELGGYSSKEARICGADFYNNIHRTYAPSQ